MIRNKQFLKKKEQGYALIIVLLVITVFSVLGLTVISVSFNHTKQFSKETTQTQALNVAEMGLKAYDEKIQNVLEHNINNDIPSNFNELVSRLNTKINDGSLPNELDSDASMLSMQGRPSYKVQMNKEDLTDSSEVKFTLISTGIAQGNQYTVTQVKIFKYQITSNGSEGENQDDSDDLNLPNLNGSLIMGDSDNANLKNPSNKQNQMDNIYIYPYTSTSNPDKRCYGAILSSSITNFDSIFNEVQNKFNQNTAVKDEVTNIPASKPTPTPTERDVTTRDFTVGTNTIVEGNLFVNGKLLLNQPLTVHGSLIVNGEIAQNSNGSLKVDNDVYSSQKLTISQPASIGGNVYSDGSMQVNNNGNLDIGKNLFIRGSAGVDRNLTVSGNAYFNGSLQVNGSGNIHIIKNLFVSGSTSIDSKITTGNDFYPGSTLSLKGSAIAEIGGNLRVGGVVNNDGEINASGNAYFQSDVNAGNGNVRIGIKGYSFFANNVSLFGSGGNKGASEFVGTVYVRGTVTAKQNHVNPNVTPQLLNFYHGMVVKNKANLTTTGQGEIDIGPIGPIEGSSDTDNGGSASREPVTVSTSETNYH